MRWVVLALLFSMPLRAQSIGDFPIIKNVSSVTVVGYTLIFDLAPARPPPIFKVWWAEMESCTGKQGDFDTIKWYQAAQVVNPLEELSYWGVYFREPPEIVILRNITPERLENTVKHEMLHHLLFGDHDEIVFNECLPLGIGG